MAKKKNHTSANQSVKAHKNGESWECSSGGVRFGGRESEAWGRRGPWRDGAMLCPRLACQRGAAVGRPGCRQRRRRPARPAFPLIDVCQCVYVRAAPTGAALLRPVRVRGGFAQPPFSSRHGSLPTVPRCLFHPPPCRHQAAQDPPCPLHQGHGPQVHPQRPPRSPRQPTRRQEAAQGASAKGLLPMPCFVAPRR